MFFAGCFIEKTGFLLLFPLGNGQETSRDPAKKDLPERIFVRYPVLD